MEAGVTSCLAFARTMSVGDIEAGIRLFMPCEKRSKRIHDRAFAYVVRSYQYIQTRLKFQLGITRLAKVLDGQLSETHEGLHPCFADEILFELECEIGRCVRWKYTKCAPVSLRVLGGQVSLLHGGIERIQSRAQGRWFLGVATSQGPDALLARASSLADQVQVLGYLAPA